MTDRLAHPLDAAEGPEPHEELRAALAALGPALGSLVDEIDRGDLVRVLTGVQIARGLRARVARHLPRAQLALARGGTSTASILLGATLREAMPTIALADKVLATWIGRALPPDDALLEAGGALLVADRALPAAWDPERDLVVLVGVGTAALAEAFVGLGVRRVVAYQAEAGPLPDGVVRADDLDAVALAVVGYAPIIPERMVIRALAGGDAEREACAEVARRIDEVLADVRIQRNTVVAFGRTWLRQGLRNLHAVVEHPSIAALDGALAGRPIVIVAPGPSLAKNVDQLRALEGRAIVLAFSHTMTALSRAGVHPDLVMTVDPQDVRYHFAQSDPSRLGAVVNAVTVCPGLFELAAPRFLTLAANGDLDEWAFGLLGERAAVPGGGSVATTAFSLALRWRCDPIVFVGLDLSFPGGQYYVPTSCDGGARAEVSADGRVRVAGWSDHAQAMKAAGGPAPVVERLIELAGYHGGTVPSSSMFAMFHRWFEDRVSRVDDVRVLNCTEGGAFIQGMRHVPLAEAIAGMPAERFDLGSLLDAARASLDPEARHRRAAGGIGRLIAEARRSRQLARRCRAALGGARAGRASAADRLGEHERDLAATLRRIPLLSTLAQPEIERAMRHASDGVSERTVRGESDRLFAAIEATADWLIPELEGAAADLRRGRPKRSR